MASLRDLINEMYINDDLKARMLNGPKEKEEKASSFFEKLRAEISSRGDFTIDVPKLVDVLFKLGVMLPKEDAEDAYGFVIEYEVKEP
jgi:hypothetical protein